MCPYKVGDKVRIVSRAPYGNLWRVSGHMRTYFGRTVTITHIDDIGAGFYFKFFEDCYGVWWHSCFIASKKVSVFSFMSRSIGKIGIWRCPTPVKWRKPELTIIERKAD